MILEEFLSRGGFFDVVIALYILYLHHKLRMMPTNHDANMEVKKIKADVDTSFLELWDYVDNSIKPIRSRVEARIRRSDRAEEKEQETLNTQETKKKKGGIIHRSSLKTYGINR